eukprot:13215007-Alexandrium_andersonii.AAC.1
MKPKTAYARPQSRALSRRATPMTGWAGPRSLPSSRPRSSASYGRAACTPSGASASACGGQ